MRAFIEQHHITSMALQVLVLLCAFVLVFIITKQCGRIYRNMEGLRQRNAQARQAAISAIPTVRTGECIEPFLARSVAPAWVNVLLMILGVAAAFGLFVNALLEAV